MEDILEQAEQIQPCLPCPRPDPPCRPLVCCRSEDWGAGPTTFSQAAYNCLLAGSACRPRPEPKPKPCFAERPDPAEEK